MEKQWNQQPLRKRLSLRNLIGMALIVVLMFCVFFYLFVAAMSGDLFWLW
jgi:hypothetical protein